MVKTLERLHRQAITYTFAFKRQSFIHSQLISSVSCRFTRSTFQQLNATWFGTITNPDATNSKRSIVLDKTYTGKTKLLNSAIPFESQNHQTPVAAAQYPVKSVRNPSTLQKQLGGYLKTFCRGELVKKRCTNLGIDLNIVKQGAEEFRLALIRNEIPSVPFDELLRKYVESSNLGSTLFPALYTFLQQRYPEQTASLSELIKSSDLRTPAELYPQARAMKRKIIMHIGPTNSGKTYAALERYKAVDSAIYCGPLRLLAQEVYQRMNAAGIACNLLTGEERRVSDGVDKWSCTVEMALVNREFDVAVVDEIQLIGDQQRGWAWTHALLALQAKEVHLCGEGTTLDIVRKLCKTTGDTLEINEYERLTSLTVAQKSLEGNFNQIKPGDAIIAFSRKNVFNAKQFVELNTPYKAAIIYGGLPPESRADQAKLFNDPESDRQVLVASDAIGMGLNLNIRRIVFYTMQKFNGTKIIPLTVSQTKQIAGRAGRFGTQWENGQVTCLETKDMALLHASMKMTAPRIMSVGITPTVEQVEQFSNSLPNDTYATLLDKFEDLAQLDGNYFMCNLDHHRAIAKLIQTIPLNIRDRYHFVQSPCNPEEPFIKAAIVKFARAHSMGEELSLDQVMLSDEEYIDHSDSPTTKLNALEVKHRVTILYLWLSQRFPTTFTEYEQAQAQRTKIEESINTALQALKPRRSSKFHENRNPAFNNHNKDSFKYNSKQVNRKTLYMVQRAVQYTENETQTKTDTLLKDEFSIPAGKKFNRESQLHYKRASKKH
ncbi:RNA helicase [Batrachochytrium dendrobatidis]|nr:RNA helicase [Batrachochytrium dendrobatidis]